MAPAAMISATMIAPAMAAPAMAIPMVPSGAADQASVIEAAACPPSAVMMLHLDDRAALDRVATCSSADWRCDGRHGVDGNRRQAGEQDVV